MLPPACIDTVDVLQQSTGILAEKWYGATFRGTVYFLDTHTHTHTTILQLSGFCLRQPGEVVREETFTHSHLSWPSVPYVLHPYTTMHGILPVQSTHLTIPSTISVQVSFGLPLGLAFFIHTPYISLPNHCLLFATHAHTIATCFAVVLRLCHLILVSLSTLYLEFCLVSRWCSFTPHIHLTILVSAH